MKKLLAIILTAAMLVSLAGCGNSESTNIPADDSTTTESTTESEGGQVLEESKVVESEPEVNTIPVRSELYHSEGDFLADVSYTYNDKGQVLTRTTTWSENYGGTVDGKLYEYDADGNVVKETTTYNGEEWDVIEYVYQNGRLVEKNWAGTRTVYTYNDDGKIIFHQDFYGDGSSGQSAVYSYDDKGNLVEKALYYSDGELSMKYRWEYNADGTVAAEIEDYIDYGISTFRYNYNSDGKLERTDSYTNDQLMFSLSCSYDKYDRLVTEGTIVWEWKFNGYYKHFYE